MYHSYGNTYKMGADWYSCMTIYGYEIKVPDTTTYRELLCKLKKLTLKYYTFKDTETKVPIQVVGLLESFHSRMEGADEDDLRYLDDDAVIVIGCTPFDLSMMVKIDKKLKTYLAKPKFAGLTFAESPAFHSGIRWENYDEDEE